MALIVQKIIEVKVLFWLTVVALIGYLGWMIYENVANKDNLNDTSLVYLIIIVVVVVIFIGIILYDRKTWKEDIGNFESQLKGYKYGENWGKFVYYMGLINVVLFLIFFGVFAYYSSAGGQNVLGIDSQRPVLPGASHGKNPKPPEDH